MRLRLCVCKLHPSPRATFSLPYILAVDDGRMGDVDDDEFFGQDDSSGPDDVGGGDTNLDNSGGLALAESRALEERFRKLGFHEGYDAAKETMLQEGFEAGYKETFSIAQEIGALLGKMAMKSKVKADGSIDRSRDAVVDEDAQSWVKERLTAPDLSTRDLEDLKKRLEDKL